MKTDNELIAEFMGFPKFEWDGKRRITWPKGKGFFKTGWYVEAFKYDTSWDMLMPVVEKISLIVYDEEWQNNGYKDILHKDFAYPRTFAMPDNYGNFMVRFNRMTLHQDKSLIKATHEAVVEFIKWYNQTKK